jgi:hypothetical protein
METTPLTEATPGQTSALFESYRSGEAKMIFEAGTSKGRYSVVLTDGTEAVRVGWVVGGGGKWNSYRGDNGEQISHGEETRAIAGHELGRAAAWS